MGEISVANVLASAVEEALYSGNRNRQTVAGEIILSSDLLLVTAADGVDRTRIQVISAEEIRGDDIVPAIQWIGRLGSLAASEQLSDTQPGHGATFN
jgi:hypothetical protein